MPSAQEGIHMQEDEASPGTSTAFLKSVLWTEAVKALGAWELKPKVEKCLTHAHTAS